MKQKRIVVPTKGEESWRLLLPSTGQLLADLEPGDVILINKVNVRLQTESRRLESEKENEV